MLVGKVSEEISYTLTERYPERPDFANFVQDYEISGTIEGEFVLKLCEGKYSCFSAKICLPRLS